MRSQSAQIKPNVKYIREEKTREVTDAEGKTTIEKEEYLRRLEKNKEPDYVKIYTTMWMDFNEIPDRARPLFLELCTRMSFADVNDLEGGQLVHTSGPTKTAICSKLGIKSSAYQTYLRELCQCRAIRKISNGCYQINPSYAGKGLYKKPSPSSNSDATGGIEDIIAKFSFAEKKVETKILYSEDPITRKKITIQDKDIEEAREEIDQAFSQDGREEADQDKWLLAAFAASEGYSEYR